MIELAIIAGVVGLVWAVSLAVRGSLVGLCLATVLIGATFGFEFWHTRLGAMPLTVDRVLELLLVLAFLAQTALGRTDPKPVRSNDRWLGLLLVYLAVST